MRIGFLLLVVASLCWTQSASLPEAGAAADSILLESLDGNALELEQLTTRNPVLLLILPALSATELCGAVTAISREPASPALERVLVLAPAMGLPPACSESGSLGIARMRAPVQTTAGASAMALIVDDSMHVRLRTPFERDDAGYGALFAMVNRWLQGRLAYEVNCGHCHGFDGAQASAPETKTLVGITRKYPDDKVLELGSLFGGVDMTGWSAAKKETLLTYLRGL